MVRCVKECIWIKDTHVRPKLRETRFFFLHNVAAAPLTRVSRYERETKIFRVFAVIVARIVAYVIVHLKILHTAALSRERNLVRISVNFGVRGGE